MKTWVNRRTGQVAQQEQRPSEEWDFVKPITRAEAIALWSVVIALCGLLIYITK